MSVLRRVGVTGLLRSTLFFAAGWFLACSPPPEQQEKSDGLESLAKREGLVYDMKLDTLAYMSCQPNSSTATDGYFTFYAGGFRTGGIALNSDFLNRMKEINRLGGDVAEIVQMSPVLKNAQPVLSIRRAHSLQSAYPDSATPFFVGFDSWSLMSRAIPSPGQFIRSLPTEDGAPIRFEGSMYFPDRDQDNLRDQFNSSDNYSLTVTVGSGAEDNFGWARAPDDDNASKSVYGVRLDLKFETNKSNDENAKNYKTDRFLTEAQEFDLKSGQQRRDRIWVCPEDYKFEIHKKHLNTEDGCPISTDPLSPSLWDLSVRQVLKAEDWSINWQAPKPAGWKGSANSKRRCIVPKRSSSSSCWDDSDSMLHNVSFCFLQE